MYLNGTKISNFRLAGTKISDFFLPDFDQRPFCVCTPGTSVCGIKLLVYAA
jgi:hypothetical protein